MQNNMVDEIINTDKENLLEDTTFIVDIDDKNTRIDKYLSDELADVSRSRIQKLLDEGMITVNNNKVKSNYKVAADDIINVHIPELVVPEIVPEDISLDIVYEDDDIIVINKPKGMVVHPAAGHYSGTLVNALMYHCRDNLSGINGVLRPGIVHRIDMNTTGVLVGVGLYYLLKKIFKEKTNKIILALAAIVTILFVSLIIIILINN